MSSFDFLSDVTAHLGGTGSAMPQSAAARVLDILRRRIIALDLPPNSVLHRGALAKEFSVSQTPVRDALHKLEIEGLVEIFPQSRTLVTRIDSDQIHEALFLRRSVEIEVVRELSGKLTDEVIARLRTIMTLQKALAEDKNNISAFQEMDEVFHQTLMSAAGQANLHGVIRAQSGHLNRVRRLDFGHEEKIARILDDHAKILDALVAGDGTRAIQNMRDHLSQTVSRVEILRARHPDFFRI